MIRVSLRLGALSAAGGTRPTWPPWTQYGRRLGLAFQITDDLLDVRSDEATVGKRVGKDAKQGKLTFPGLLGVEQSEAYAEAADCRGVRGAGAAGPAAAGLEALARYVLERNR